MPSTGTIGRSSCATVLETIPLPWGRLPIAGIGDGETHLCWQPLHHARTTQLSERPRSEPLPPPAAAHTKVLSSNAAWLLLRKTLQAAKQAPSATPDQPATHDIWIVEQ
uniref:Uncharacterized protein n=1 Tax=Pyrodinium bahamense TaxID=73915 RepID=A0A7S0B460_9DINO